MQYLPRPGDRPRLIVLIGTFNLGFRDTEVAPTSQHIIKGFYCNYLSTATNLIMSTGSVGARISELKQKVIAENPRSYGLAVPRKCIYTAFHLSVAWLFVVDLKLY